MPPLELEMLRRSSVLASLPDAELEQVAGLMRQRTYRRGQPVFHQGDLGQSLHLLLAGQVKVVLPTASGEEALLSILGPGDIFGELALLDGGPRSATVVALEPIDTAVLLRDDFLSLLQRSRPAVEGLLATLAGKVRRLTENVGDLMFLDQQGRLAKKLLELVESSAQPSDGGTEPAEIPLTQDELAMMIGATRSRVNQMLGLFEAQGALARGRKRIVILKPEVLRHRVIL